MGVGCADTSSAEGSRTGPESGTLLWAFPQVNASLRELIVVELLCTAAGEAILWTREMPKR